MESFRREDFEKLAQITNELCISIHIPTHRKGMEVNENYDRTNFKNHLQTIRQHLESLGYQSSYVEELLQPALLLQDDTGFWREQLEGLAFFLCPQGHWSFRVPENLESLALVSSKFELAPLAPLVSENHPFYIAGISQSNVSFYKADKYFIEPVNIRGKVPANIKEVYEYHEFDRTVGGKKVSNESNIHEGIGNIMYDSSQGYLDTDKYIPEFLRKIDAGIKAYLHNQDAPLVLVSNSSLFGLYQKVNSYNNLLSEGVDRQPEDLSMEELHKRAYSIAKKELEKPKKKALQKFEAFAGTGKTSYDTKDIVISAFAGRVESLFIPKDVHIWGRYNEEEQSIEIHNEYQTGDVCLVNLATIKTIENSGIVYSIKEEELQAKPEGSEIAAIYRY